MRHAILFTAAVLVTHNTAMAQTVRIRVDATAERHPISPLIYGVSFGSPEQLKALNCPLNRSGGNGTTRYNWKENASNHANDWFFESIGDKSPEAGESVDSFIAASRSAGAEPMVTIPTIGWVAHLGPGREKQASFSVKRYGAQQKTDQWMPDAGNGVGADGKEIVGNDPNDAHVRSTPAFQQGWVEHLKTKWGGAGKGGPRWYFMDNEPGIWQSTHRDVHPKGPTMEEVRDYTLAYGAMVKKVDPSAMVAGPEEWGWLGYIYSGADEQYRGQHGYQGQPDSDAHGGMQFGPWLLQQMSLEQKKSGNRILDAFTVHIYPQGGDGGNDTSAKIQALRNRSTRALWDPDYVDESWIKEKINLIPRLHAWVNQYVTAHGSRYFGDAVTGTCF